MNAVDTQKNYKSVFNLQEQPTINIPELGELHLTIRNGELIKNSNILNLDKTILSGQHEMIDLDESENWWAHRWDIKSIGNSNPLDKQMAESKNETEIKIGVYASMKIASAISNNIDELKTNSYLVIELHKEIVKGIKNEEDLFEANESNVSND